MAAPRPPGWSRQSLAGRGFQHICHAFAGSPQPVGLRLRTTLVKDTIYRAVVKVARAIFWALDLQIDVVGSGNIPTSGPVVIAANHSSFVDFMLVGLPAVRRGRLVRFMAKESVFRSVVGGPLMRGMGHIPVDRRHGAIAARHALRALRRGEVVGVYPEATIGHAFLLKDRGDVRRGAAYLSIATGAPLVPVAHWGLHRVWTVGGHLSLRRGYAVRLVVGEPLRAHPGESAEGLTDRLHLRMSAMVDDLVRGHPQRPACPRGAWWWPAVHGGAAPTAGMARAMDLAGVRRADGGHPRGKPDMAFRP